MIDHLINVILILGAIQGFVFGLLILGSKKYKVLSTYFLIALILIISYNNLQYFLFRIGVVPGDIFYQTIYLPMGILIPPSLYFYTITFLNPDMKIRVKKEWMYLPFLFFLIVSSGYKILHLFKINFENYFWIFSALLTLHETITLVFMLTVLIVLIKRIIDFKAKVKRANYKKVIPATNWLLYIVIISLFNMIIYSYFVVNIFTNTSDGEIIYGVWVINSILIYILGHIGIYKFSIQQERKKIRALSALSQATLKIKTSTNENIILLEERLIKEQLFLDPSLTLESLADEINISKSHLSRVFNNELKKSFSDCINQLRVDKAKSYLENANFSKYTLLAIGLEAGFNSKTTFNTSFKKFTGVTPSQYRNNNLERVES